MEVEYIKRIHNYLTTSVGGTDHESAGKKIPGFSFIRAVVHLGKSVKGKRRTVPIEICTGPQFIFAHTSQKYHNFYEYGSLIGERNMSKPSMKYNVLDAVDRNAASCIHTVGATVE